MSSIYGGIKKVNPVGSMNKPNTTNTPPKQQNTQQDKKPPKKKDKDSIVDIYAEESDSSNFQHRIKNMISQNPKGSAAEKILLGRFLGSDQGSYARNVLGKNHKEWIDHITWWLKMYQPKLQKEFTEVDFTDLESLAYDMYETYLAKQGQLEESEGYSAGAVGGAGLDEGDVIIGPWPGSGAKPQQDKIQAPAQDKKPVSKNISNVFILADKVMNFILKRKIVNIDDPYKDIEDALRALRIKYNQQQVFDIWQRMKQTGFDKDMRYDIIDVDEGQIYSTGGGAGQGYHWYKPQPAGLKEYADTTEQINYESAIMKGLQSEEIGNDRELRRQKRSQEIDSQIKKAYPYLVRNSKTGLEKEFMNMDDAIKFAQQEALPSLDSATVVYDRNSKFPVVAYRGSEEVYSQRNKMNEYGEVDSSRKKEFNKDNPPSLDMLYRQFIQTMTSDKNTIEPKVWIDSANKNYGLNYTYKNYQDFGHRNDHVGGWDKFVQKHVLRK